MTREINTLVEGFCLAEAPRWRNGRLYFSDVYCKTVYSSGLDGDLEVVTIAPGNPSGLGWTCAGELLIVGMNERRIWSFDGATLEVYAQLDDPSAGALNDMIVDEHGRAYVAGIGSDLSMREEMRPSSLYLVDENRRFLEMATGVMFGNGLALSDNGATLILAETRANRLTAFDRREDGTLTNRRVFAELAYGPDGISIDSEGAVWVALPGAERCVRVLPDGSVAEVAEVPGRLAIACELGGPDGRTLFITTTGAWQRAAHGRAEHAMRIRGANVCFTTVDVPSA